MRSRITILLITLFLIGMSIILFATTGYNAVYVLAITMMIAGFVFLFFRAHIGIALLVSSTIILLIVNGLRRTMTSNGSIMANNINVGQLSIPLGYFILVVLILIVSKVLVNSIRGNRR